MQLSSLLLVAGCVVGCSSASGPAVESPGGNAAVSGTSGGGDTQAGSGTVAEGGRPGGSAGVSGRSNGSTEGGAGVTPPVSETPGCGLDSAAFCETFEKPHPGGRAGDLDESLWSFTRWAHAAQYFWLRMPAHTYKDALFPSSFCGKPFSGILPPDDVRICSGVGADGKTTSNQLHEVFDDQGDFAFHSMRIRQPFDFKGRTGKIVWDVDGKFNPYHFGHGWWFEMWITEDPTPMPYHEAPMVFAFPRNGFGLAFRFSAGVCRGENERKPFYAQGGDEVWMNAPETVFVVKDYRLQEFQEAGEAMGEEQCFRSADAKLNHFELRISKNQVELWASDFENPASFKRRAILKNLNLPFERGYVHFQHGAYNAGKDGKDDACTDGGAAPPGSCPSHSQTFRWDNIGFDGPVLKTPRGYDVLDRLAPGPEGGVYTGWEIGDRNIHDFTVKGVDLSNAVRATFNFNIVKSAGEKLEYRFNGNAWHTFTLEGIGEGGLMSYSLEIPVEELVEGDNVISVRNVDPVETNGIGNMDISVEVQ